MIPVPPGSLSKRRKGKGFTMSNTRKSIRLANRYFQCGGTPTRAIIWPATSSITTKPGSSLPLSLATTVEGAIPSSVTAIATATPTGASHVEGMIRLAPHHNKTMTVAAYVPGPGRKKPTPKKVAMSHEPGDLRVVEGRMYSSSYRRALTDEHSAVSNQHSAVEHFRAPWATDDGTYRLQDRLS